MKEFETIFDSDRFTENAMPFLTVLGKLIDQTYGIKASEVMADCMHRYADKNDKFMDSLNDEQRELFEEIGYTMDEVARIDLVEHFNKGFVLGSLLMKEIFSSFIRPEHHQ